MHKLVVGLLVLHLSGAIGIVAGNAVLPPEDELCVKCISGCARSLEEESSFYVNDNIPAVVLDGGRCGEWFENGKTIGSGEKIMIMMNGEKEIRFVVGGREKTVHLKTIKLKRCLPNFESEISIVGDDKDKEWFFAGERFVVEADIDENDCEEYHFRWETDNDTLEIADCDLARTEVYVKDLPDSGNVKLAAVLWNDAGDRKEEDLTVRIEGALPPELEIAVSVEGDDFPKQIIVLRTDTAASGNDGKIDEFYVELYYYDNFGWELIDQASCRGEKLILTADEGEGYYKILAYVKDSHGIRSGAVEAFVVVEESNDEIPHVYVANDKICCHAGENCHIDAGQTYYHNKNADIRYYDCQGRRFDCSGPECDINYSEPGEYIVEVRAYLFGDDLERYNKKEVTVDVDC